MTRRQWRKRRRNQNRWIRLWARQSLYETAQQYRLRYLTPGTWDDARNGRIRASARSAALT